MFFYKLRLNSRKGKTRKNEKKDEENPNELSNLETQILKPADRAYEDENEIQVMESSQMSIEEPINPRFSNGITPIKSAPKKGRPPGSKNKKTNEDSRKSGQRSGFSVSAVQFSIPEDLNEPLPEHSADQATATITKPNSEEILPNASTSFLDESIEPWRENTCLSESQVTDSMTGASQTLNSLQSSQIDEEIVIKEYVKAPSGHVESTFGGSHNLPSQLISKKLRSLSKIATMNFSLRPYILKGILSPGKNNVKMNFNNRVYIASLTASGTLEMNGFTFPSIGYWIKSVEGKRFGNFPAIDKKTLNLLYNGKPLEDLLDMEENSQKALEPTKKYNEIPLKPTPKSNTTSKSTNSSASLDVTVPNSELRNNENLKLVPDEMTRHIKSVFLHAPDEYFPICQCVEQYWNGKQPFPRHLLDEVDSW